MSQPVAGEHLPCHDVKSIAHDGEREKLRGTEVDKRWKGSIDDNLMEKPGELLLLHSYERNLSRHTFL
jgi:hypothetical protein